LLKKGFTAIDVVGIVMKGGEMIAGRRAKQPITKAASKSSERSRQPNGLDPSPDPVLTILSQWQRERPDLDSAPMQLFGGLARVQLLSDVYLNAVVDQWGLSRGSFDVLAALRRAGSPFSLTPKQLSSSLMLSGAGMTSRLDRLEALKLIVRLPEVNDRRSLRIQLTSRGVRLIDKVVPAVIEAQWKVASALGPEQMRSLTEALGALTKILAGTAGR
jgi:DNA-binding MarR family transcriptional regulator